MTLRQLFQQLVGTWQLDRQVRSHCLTLPSGHLTGKANFTTQQIATSYHQQTYQYQEYGHFTSVHQVVLYSQQTYIYRLNTILDQISVWATNRDDIALNEPLHILDACVAPDTPHHPYHVKVTAHQCNQDNYQVHYHFYCIAEQLNHWTSIYVVKGPQKDYRIENHYTRDTDSIMQNT